MKLTPNQLKLKISLKPIIESILREANSPMSVGRVIKSTNPGLNFTFIIENPKYKSVELKVVPETERDSQWLSSNKDKFASVLKNPKFETAVLSAYSKKTGTTWGYIDDLNGTIASLNSGMY
jgi:hypothetical protein